MFLFAAHCNFLVSVDENHTKMFKPALIPASTLPSRLKHCGRPQALAVPEEGIRVQAGENKHRTENPQTKPAMVVQARDCLRYMYSEPGLLPGLRNSTNTPLCQEPQACVFVRQSTVSGILKCTALSILSTGHGQNVRRSPLPVPRRLHIGRRRRTLYVNSAHAALGPLSLRE